MPLSWNEIRDRATAFAHDWAGEAYERGEAQTFWNEFFQVFGLTRRRVASFEAHVKKLDDHSGLADRFRAAVSTARKVSAAGGREMGRMNSAIEAPARFGYTEFVDTRMV